MTLLYCILAAVVAMVVLAVIGRHQPLWTKAAMVSSISRVHGPYWYRVLVGLDCFANVITGGLVGETISARCGRWALVVQGHGTVWHWLARFMVKWLGVIQPDHGQRAIVGTLTRAEQLIEVERAALDALGTPPEERAA